MKKVLEYIYCGKVEISGEAETKDFFRATQALQIHTNANDVNIDEILAKNLKEVIWSNRGATFASSFKLLYELQDGCDVTLGIGDMELKAHRIALSASSVFFDRMLSLMPGELEVTCKCINGEMNSIVTFTCIVLELFGFLHRNPHRDRV